MLTFNLKKEWFEKIKSGEKTHEYREANYFWKIRIEYQAGGERKFSEQTGNFYITKETGIKEGSTICFACGYPKKDDESRRIYAKFKRLTYLNSGINTDLKIDKPVYDIEFELIN